MNNMLKPYIFIGSSSESKPTAEAIQKVLSNYFEVDLWSDGIFDLGESTLDELIKFVQCYDFSVLVLAEDDITLSRKDLQSAPRDNVIFELGLFMGALGRRRTFPVIRPAKTGSLKLPSDLLGNTQIYLPKNLPDAPEAEDIETEIKQLVETITERSKEATLQLLPSTGLAIGYFNNFVLPVCQQLANQSHVTVGGKEIDISQDNFDFTIVLPKSLSDASIYGAKKFVKVKNADQFQLNVSSRPYNFYVDAVMENGRVVFYDYPTTLGASHEAVQIALAGPFLAAGQKRQMILDAKEIANFVRTLDILLLKPSCAEFRDNIKFVQAS
jgi:hypothetical protein